MIEVVRMLRELPRLPKPGEEFPVLPREAATGSLLVEKIHVQHRRDGTSIVRIWGFG
jgi:hypothetical protein